MHHRCRIVYYYYYNIYVYTTIYIPYILLTDAHYFRVAAYSMPGD